MLGADQAEDKKIITKEDTSVDHINEPKLEEESDDEEDPEEDPEEYEEEMEDPDEYEEMEDPEHDLSNEARILGLLKFLIDIVIFQINLLLKHTNKKMGKSKMDWL